ncbi:hypothetical protein ACFOGG_03595 [Brenneria rubrifaciens]|uniref:hypothetical protein n=1 Tax=Brenneria rubrifaciens TaxID=55213 RepID=UPI00360B7E52
MPLLLPEFVRKWKLLVVKTVGVKRLTLSGDFYGGLPPVALKTFQTIFYQKIVARVVVLSSRAQL